MGSLQTLIGKIRKRKKIIEEEITEEKIKTIEEKIKMTEEKIKKGKIFRKVLLKREMSYYLW